MYPAQAKKNILPEATLKMIYSSLINSHLNYGILVWEYKLSNIFKLQKKAIRAITRSKFNAHTQPLFKKLNILTVSDIYKLKLYKFYYRLNKNSIPHYFYTSNILIRQQDDHSYNTRNNRYTIPRIRHKYGEHCLRYNLPKQLNDTPSCILEKVLTHSEQGLCRYAKYILINTYQEYCSIINCYICKQ